MLVHHGAVLVAADVRGNQCTLDRRRKAGNAGVCKR
jgi:hypothetical protein